ncbi:MAG: hypothetical protein J7M32_11720 [Deltaproteobacteria bacterium]|nr:hypothetical protein [Deltaproteobacteria bacterium]
MTFVYRIRWDSPGNRSIPNIRLGARIRTNNPQGAWKDDSANDKIITVFPGDNDYSRQFRIPTTATAGYYDTGWVILEHTSETWLDEKVHVSFLRIVAPTTTTTSSTTSTTTTSTTSTSTTTISPTTTTSTTTSSTSTTTTTSTTSPTTTLPLFPYVQIKANGQDNPITASPSEPVSITVSLDPGSFGNYNADWWIAVNTPFAPPGDWYSYIYPLGWFPGIYLCIQNPLFNLYPPFEVLNMILPPGSYTFYFAVDPPDGAVTAEVLDSVEVNVE